MAAGSQKKKTKVLYWITLVRACLAFILGFGVLFILLPGERLPLLPNFMGLYWFVSGIFTLRMWRGGERAKFLPLLAGLIGILTGFLVLIGRSFSDELGLLILGTVITLTGLLRILGGFTMQERDILHRSRSVLFLGFFEVVLGVLLIGVVRIENESTVYTVAGVWALFGSMVLFGDAMQIRQRVLQQQAMSASSSGPNIQDEGK